MPDVDERRPLTEQELVEDWREARLIAAGYPADDAIELARRNDVDLHKAVALLAAQCPLETALNILR